MEETERAGYGAFLKGLHASLRALNFIRRKTVK